MDFGFFGCVLVDFMDGVVVGFDYIVGFKFINDMEEWGVGFVFFCYFGYVFSVVLVYID